MTDVLSKLGNISATSRSNISTEGWVCCSLNPLFHLGTNLVTHRVVRIAVEGNRRFPSFRRMVNARPTSRPQYRIVWR